MSVRLSLVVSGVLGLVACAADRSGLGLSDGGGFDGQFDGGFECPEGTFDLDGDGRCECTFSSDVESCDGIDNDCDLSTPDGADDPTVGLPCDGGDLDFCEDGVYACGETGYTCEEPTDNDAELCDGANDDDCDGTVDEGCPCTEGDTRGCGIDTGLCTLGLSNCEARPDCPGGTPTCWSSCSGVGPTEDVCNALDDDCDGRTDEALDAGCWVDGDSDTYAMAGAASTCLPAGGCPGGFTTRRPVSGMQDCNDGAMGINPGASEICDLIDQDCDGRIDEGLTLGCWPDGDGDSYAVRNAPGRCVPVVGGCPSGTTTRNPATAANQDCDDTNAAVRPGAMEICNGIDDNCAGGVDNGLPDGCWDDGDRDGYARSGAAGRCAPSGGCPVGTTDREPSGASNIDCNDGNAMIRPGQPEVCNGIDDNCAGGADEGIAPGCWADGDRDGFAPNGATGQCRPSAGCPGGTTATNPSSAATIDCNDTNASIRPGAVETCNNVNDDCDSNTDEGVTPRGCSTACGSGVETCTAGTFGGCTARMPTPEVCNGMDDDCVGGVDDGVPFGCWADPDGDGYATASAAAQCEPGSGCPAGMTDREPASESSRDCREGDEDTYPGADELCDGVDNDCDGSLVGECGTNCQAAIDSGRFYVFCNRTNRDYGQGSSDCASIGSTAGSSGMDLVSINSNTEQTFVQTTALMIANNDWWIGLYRTGGGSPMWTWEDGTTAPQNSSEAPPPYNNWAVGEPDGTGNCARMQTSGQWGDRNCNDNLRYVCEGPIP